MVFPRILFLVFTFIFEIYITNLGILKPSQIYVSCTSLSSKSLDKWRQIGANVTDKNGLVVTKSDIIFICVKPHVMYQCAQQIEGNIEPAVCDSDKLFVSLMTGVTLDKLELVECNQSLDRLSTVVIVRNVFFRLLVL